MSKYDCIAIVICFFTLAAGIFTSLQIYEGIPHIEDEIAFVWQARVIETGQLSIPSPEPSPDSFKVPFVVDFQGKRFGKYPPGWPVVLAVGELLNARYLINPILTGISFWLMYRLISKIVNQRIAIGAIGLGSISPFVWMNSGSLLSHPWSLCLTLIFVISWIDTFNRQSNSTISQHCSFITILTASLSLGLLALTRPWTAVGVSLPFIIYWIILFLHGDRTIRIRLISFASITGVIATLYYVWQFSVTGDLFINPYKLWWPYDQIGLGPEIGAHPEGYRLSNALANTLFSLFVGNTDLFGWPVISWIFLPFGFYALHRDIRSWLLAALLFSLVCAYALYWTPSWIYGPRYYYEALPVVLMFSSAGIFWLSGFFNQHKKSSITIIERLRFILVSFIVLLLIGSNVIFYLPLRLQGMIGLYGINSNCSTPFREFLQDQNQPILVFIELQRSFHEYSCTLDQTSPLLDSPLVTAISRDKETDELVAKKFPERSIYYYQPDTQQFLKVFSNNHFPVTR